MRSDRLAQRILSLVVPSERAASIVGDLVEGTSSRRPTWFWMSLARVVTASLCQDVLRAPLRFAGFAAISWFAYMLVSLVLVGVGIASSFPLWAIAYVFSNHTGVELLTDWLGVRVEWGMPAAGLTRAVELMMLAVAAPFLTGRLAACWWPRRELAAAVMMSALWPLLAVFAPIVVHRASTTIGVLPVIVASMFLGTLWGRIRQPSLPLI